MPFCEPVAGTAKRKWIFNDMQHRSTPGKGIEGGIAADSKTDQNRSNWIIGF